MGTYCQEVAVTDLSTTRTFTCPLLVEKAPDLWKKTQIVGTQIHYTFEVAKTEEIFYFRVKEKFITTLKDHQIPNKDEVRGKDEKFIILMHVWVSEMSCKIGSTTGY